MRGDLIEVYCRLDQFHLGIMYTTNIVCMQFTYIQKYMQTHIHAQTYMHTHANRYTHIIMCMFSDTCTHTYTRLLHSHPCTPHFHPASGILSFFYTFRDPASKAMITQEVVPCTTPSPLQQTQGATHLISLGRLSEESIRFHLEKRGSRRLWREIWSRGLLVVVKCIGYLYA